MSNNTLEPQAALPDEMVAKATEAAMRDAVKAGLVPKYDDMDSTVKHWDGMTAVVRAALTAADVPGLLAEVERLRGLLKDIQWEGSSDYPRCPDCQADSNETGGKHWEDCRIAAALTGKS